MRAIQATTTYLLVVAPVYVLLMAAPVVPALFDGYLLGFWELHARLGGLIAAAACPALAAAFVGAVLPAAARGAPRRVVPVFAVLLWAPAAWAAMKLCGQDGVIGHAPVSSAATLALAVWLTLPPGDGAAPIVRRLPRARAVPLVLLAALVAFLRGSTPPPESLAGCYAMAAAPEEDRMDHGAPQTLVLELRPGGIVEKLFEPPRPAFTMHVLMDDGALWTRRGWIPAPAGGMRLSASERTFGWEVFLAPRGGELRGTLGSWSQYEGRYDVFRVHAWRVRCPRSIPTQITPQHEYIDSL